MIACPVCRAENGQGPNCRHCKADLSMLFAIVAEQQRHLHAAVGAIEAGKPDPALVHLDEAEKMRLDPRIPQLRAVAEAMRGRFNVALGQYLEAEAKTKPPVR